MEIEWLLFRGVQLRCSLPLRLSGPAYTRRMHRSDCLAHRQRQFWNDAPRRLDTALAVHSPGHMLETKWKAALYVDERSALEQCDALTKIFVGQAGGHLAKLTPYIGEMLGVKAASIEYFARSRRRRMTIHGLAEIDIEGLPGQRGAEVTLADMPFCIAPGIPAVVAKSKRLSYRDFGFRWEITDKNGYYSQFTYQG